jgi:hypothetical protein
MLTVVIRDDGEENVIQLTYENLWKELKDIVGAELIVSTDWFDALGKIKTPYVCFVEADCLVNSGYFQSQLGLFKKNKYLRKLAMLTSATGVNTWENRFFGYGIEEQWSDPVMLDGGEELRQLNYRVQPIKTKKSSAVYPIQMGYVPGSLIHVRMLKDALAKLNIQTMPRDNLIELSTMLSIAFWSQGDGNRVHINPNSTYVTTESYVNELSAVPVDGLALLDKFKRESI